MEEDCKALTKEDCKALTAFTVGPLGFYECERMPFGLMNAPATFQCLMQSCLGNLHLQYCIIYLDDIIVFSKTPEENLVRLQAIFEKLKRAELKLKPSKYEFFRQELTYLGHVVSKNGIQTDSKKVEAIQKWPIQPMSLKCIASLGLPISTRDSSRNMHKPLYKLISGENAARKQNLIKWDLECQEAFDKLRELCTITPILAYANFGKPLKLHTDASVSGLGAVQYQVQDGVEKVISYASQSLSKSKSKYPIHKLEFLCLKWAVTDQFHEYLYGNTLNSAYNEKKYVEILLCYRQLFVKGNVIIEE